MSTISGVEIAKGEASLLIILGSKDGVIFWCDAGAARSLLKLFLLDDSPLLMKFFLSIDHQQQASLSTNTFLRTTHCPTCNHLLMCAQFVDRNNDDVCAAGFVDQNKIEMTHC